MRIQDQISGKETNVVHMVFDGFLTPTCLLQPVLKAIQDRLVRQLNRSYPLLIRVSMVSFRHGTSLLLRLAVVASLASHSHSNLSRESVLSRKGMPQISQAMGRGRPAKTAASAASIA